MSITSSPNLLSQRRMTRLVTQIRTTGDERRIEAVTGRVNNIREATQGQVGKIQLLEKSLSDTQKYRESLDIANYRVEAMQTALNSLSETTQRVNQDALSALSFDNPETTKLVANEARAALGVTFATLNLQTGGRFIFSGNTIDTAPLGDLDTMMNDLKTIMNAAPDAATAVTDIDAYFDDPAGGFQTNIYTGSDANASDIEIGPGQRIQMDTRADNAAFKTVLKGLAMIALAGEEGAPDQKARDLIEAGSGKMIQSQYDVVNLNARIGNTLAEIGVAESTQSATEQSLTIALNNFTGVDQLEAATLMQSLDTQLEAAFAATARISRLTLLNYIS